MTHQPVARSFDNPRILREQAAAPAVDPKTRLRNAGRVNRYSDNPTGELFRDGFLVAVANPEVLLFLAAAASIALPFLSATALALSIGVIAAVAGVLTCVIRGLWGE